MPKVIIHRLIAVLNKPAHIADEIKYGQSVLTAMTGNPLYPGADVVLKPLAASLSKYDTTTTASKTRASGTVAARRAARVVFIACLDDTRGFVQHLADADPENAEPIITGAAMSVRKLPVRAPQSFGVTQGSVSGQVHVHTPSAGRAAYEWQYSLDGGKTWQDVEPTLQARTTISGLPAGTTVLFRHRILTRAGRGDWSVPTSFLVK
jgi:hypothetical protein